VQTAPARPGLIIVDESLSVVGSNNEALQILTFPEQPERIQHLDLWLSRKIRSIFVERRPPFRVMEDFRSAKRTYRCRTFPLGFTLPHQNGSRAHNGSSHSAEMLIVMLERRNSEALTIAELSDRFGLTTREQETVKFLFEGLTSKEIAERMQISPNTVKAFIRLVMVKMNVSTRSGIIGKIVGWKAPSGLEPDRE
jgi:DNA-binding CsgD family transcriptional regulator